MLEATTAAEATNRIPASDIHLPPARDNDTGMFPSAPPPAYSSLNIRTIDSGTKADAPPASHKPSASPSICSEKDTPPASHTPSPPPSPSICDEEDTPPASYTTFESPRIYSEEDAPTATEDLSARPRARPAPTAGHVEPDDFLVADARHNRTRPLCQLSDDILLQILWHLDDDPASVECLRRVSRRFPPLVAASVRLSPSYLRSPRASPNLDGPFPWPRLWDMGRGGAPLGPSGCELERRLDRDRYCAGCLSARGAPDWLERVKRLRKYYKCDGCNVYHPACLFFPSKRQPRGPSFDYGQCIGIQGWIRICSHETGIVLWPWIGDMLARERCTTSPDCSVFNGVRCWHSSHRTRCAGRGYDAWAKKLGRVYHGARGLGHEQGRILGDDDWCPSIYIAREPITEESITADSNSEERESCTDKYITEKPKKTLVISWYAHIPFDRVREWPLTAGPLRRHLAGLSDNVGRFLTRTTQPQIQGMPELRCFDPNDCDCVYFEGSEDVDWRPYRPVQQAVGPDTNRDGACSKCHSDPARRIVPFPYRRRPSSSERDTDLDRLSSDPMRTCRWEPEEFLLAERCHRTRTRYATGEYLQKAGEYTIGVTLCHGAKPCIQVEYLKTIGHDLSDNGPVPVSWYESLESASYSITKDAEGYGIYWCREPGCCNYYKNSPGFSRFLSGYRHLPGGENLGPLPYHRR